MSVLTSSAFICTTTNARRCESREHFIDWRWPLSVIKFHTFLHQLELFLTWIFLLALVYASLTALFRRDVAFDLKLNFMLHEKRLNVIYWLRGERGRVSPQNRFSPSTFCEVCEHASLYRLYHFVSNHGIIRFKGGNLHFIEYSSIWVGNAFEILLGTEYRIQRTSLDSFKKLMPFINAKTTLWDDWFKFLNFPEVTSVNF